MRQMSREDFGCLLLREDFVPGGKCPGRILCVYYCGRILYWEDFVREDFVWEDFVLGGFSTGRILCGRILYPGGFCAGRQMGCILNFAISKDKSIKFAAICLNNLKL